MKQTGFGVIQLRQGHKNGAQVRNDVHVGTQQCFSKMELLESHRSIRYCDTPHGPKFTERLALGSKGEEGDCQV